MPSPLPAEREFPATHWTLVAAASGPERETAMGRLYQIYWTPLCAQARRFGVPESDVKDVVQELFVSLLRSGAIGRADQARGRFRSYLLGALRNQLSHRRLRETSQKRGGGCTTVPVDSIDLPQTPSPAPVDEREFDAEWAHALLAEALRRMHVETQYGDEARTSWEVLSPMALGDADVSCDDAARRLGITVPAVKTRIFRLRQRFREILREEVLRTVAGEEECDAELQYLSVVVEKSSGMPALPRAV